jgi:hypothetical protein
VRPWKTTAQKIAASGSLASVFVNFHGFGCRENGGMKADTTFPRSTATDDLRDGFCGFCGFA